MFNSKYFPKIIYLFLSVLFVYNSFGYLLLYFPARTIIKYTVFEAIEKEEIAPEDLSVLTFNIKDLKANKYDFIWVKPGKEFRFNGKMYDIEDKEVTNDSVYYTCYYDQKENLIEEMFALHFNDYNKDKTQNSVQRIIFIGLYSEEINSSYSKLYNENIINIPLLKKEAAFLNLIKDIPTPPPRFVV